MAAVFYLLFFINNTFLCYTLLHIRPFLSSLLVNFLYFSYFYLFSSPSVVKISYLIFLIFSIFLCYSPFCVLPFFSSSYPSSHLYLLSTLDLMMMTIILMIMMLLAVVIYLFIYLFNFLFIFLFLTHCMLQSLVFSLSF